ncbi:uncharacterized protein LACBIDRAFT_303947 [Laccaria bicolor S238N-H82]|uniref:Predicted protein n=1 Tax=Laccaria bicolor (strain S238N-H82 / ATCC MYA-4686) TaxID=486041 RepID=B0D1U7_LACBS|nr:uncharacterized protein LACBIDRAFT_314218 [Laccaria bicolor S238N-H82]XP_001891024.1 uncharacterized protein LACBIDRAFT_303947 [Laccaria bicolor S238N-H82]EDQ98323.1 predicted protein [Laccaria bicolor S238N-H82]EDR12050.1 predicted protein [Laccaria bicolor S238N-H82]|eukprot:XP_001877947.1 predicted protein [Laccaria bicolor S238N-H82]
MWVTSFIMSLTHHSKVIRNSVTYTEHAERKTVTTLDIVYALGRSGRMLTVLEH